VGGLLFGGRRRLTSALHRRKAIELIGEANAAGACLVSACSEIGICLRTLKRWRKAFLGDGDGKAPRKGSPRLVSNRLSEEERQRILLTCNQPEYASLPPGQIVPALADQGLFIGSESSFYRALHLGWTVPPPRAGPAASGTALRAASAGGSPKCALVVGHQLPADHGAGGVAVPLFGGRRLEPQGVGLGCGRGRVGPDRSGSGAAGLHQGCATTAPAALAAASASSSY
jgi:transposase-like protein